MKPRQARQELERAFAAFQNGVEAVEAQSELTASAMRAELRQLLSELYTAKRVADQLGLLAPQGDGAEADATHQAQSTRATEAPVRARRKRRATKRVPEQPQCAAALGAALANWGEDDAPDRYIGAHGTLKPLSD